MSEPYLGEIRMFAGNFAPKGNAYCAGQIISIQQNAALFSLLGTYYGGNGTTTFGLPDFRSRIPVCMGQGPGLSNYTIGEAIGTEAVTLNSATIPVHSHAPQASTQNAGQQKPGGAISSALQSPFTHFWVSNANKATSGQFNTTVLGMTGGNQPHENRMPSIALSMIIALVGVFPSRN